MPAAAWKRRQSRGAEVRGPGRGAQRDGRDAIALRTPGEVAEEQPALLTQGHRTGVGDRFAGPGAVAFGGAVGGTQSGDGGDRGQERGGDDEDEQFGTGTSCATPSVEGGDRESGRAPEPAAATVRAPSGPRYIQPAPKSSEPPKRARACAVCTSARPLAVSCGGQQRTRRGHQHAVGGRVERAEQHEYAPGRHQTAAPGREEQQICDEQRPVPREEDPAGGRSGRPAVPAAPPAAGIRRPRRRAAAGSTGWAGRDGAGAADRGTSRSP